GEVRRRQRAGGGAAAAGERRGAATAAGACRLGAGAGGVRLGRQVCAGAGRVRGVDRVAKHVGSRENGLSVRPPGQPLREHFGNPGRVLIERRPAAVLTLKGPRMADVPPTRASLLVRIRDARDAAAWGEFVDLYAPLVHGFARRQGLQDADAADLTQDVL